MILVLARRHARAYLHAPGAAAALIAYYLLLGYLFAAPLFAFGQASLRPILEAAPLLQTFLIAALTMGLLASELESGTFETLVSFPVESRDVVLGKFLGFAAFHALTIALLLVYAAAARSLAAPPAGLDWGEAFGVLAALWAQGLLLGAAGLWASSLVRGQLAAFSLSFALGLALLMIGKTAAYAPGPIARAMEFVSLDARMAALGRGVFDTRDGLYFVSACAFFLYLAVMSLEFRRTRFGKTPLFSVAGAAILVAALAAANLGGALAWTRLDFSAARAYSLSPKTVEALRALDEPLTARVYFTGGLPAPYSANERYLRDLLSEYAAAARGKFAVQWNDPSSSPEVEKAARAAGATSVQVNLVARGEFSAREAYMGVALFSGAKKETLPVLGSTADLEYELTRRLMRLGAKEKRTVGFVAGHAERDPGDPSVAPLYELFREQMKLSAADLEQAWPGKLDALWLLSPTRPFKPKEIQRLREWVEGGGALGVLYNRRALDYDAYTSRPRPLGLEDLFKGWGVALSDAFVADAQSDRVELQRRVGPYIATSVKEYPLIPVVTRLSDKHPAVRGLSAVPFPFAHALELSAPPPGVSLTPLAESSPRSWLREERSIAPDMPADQPSSGPAGPFVLAAALEGSFKPGAPPARVVIVGTGQHVEPRFANRKAGLDFIFNLLEWSYGEEGLLALRAKGPSYRPLRPIAGARARLFIRATLAACLPLAVLAIALLLARARARSRARRARDFGAA